MGIIEGAARTAIFKAKNINRSFSSEQEYKRQMGEYAYAPEKKREEERAEKKAACEIAGAKKDFKGDIEALMAFIKQCPDDLAKGLRTIADYGMIIIDDSYKRKDGDTRSIRKAKDNRSCVVFVGRYPQFRVEVAKMELTEGEIKKITKECKKCRETNNCLEDALLAKKVRKCANIWKDYCLKGTI
ncbi:MAG: hypothetical protein FWH47_02940 [Methanomassiliicoccaceae archaeon]|nr:hypothetical protein [Methanomassiliicoccaceae archaeon]